VGDDVPMAGARRIFAKFTGKEILLERGRLLFSILDLFANRGYEVTLFDNFADRELGKYGGLIHTLPGIELSDRPRGDIEEAIYLFDREERHLGRRPWRKKVQVRFDLFAPFWFSDPLIMPFPMHPSQANTSHERLLRCRSRVRSLRLFFAGDTEHYSREWVRFPRSKMARLPVINAVREELGEEVVIVDDAEELSRLAGDGYTRKCVLTGSSEVRIPPESWLDAIAAADFFLAPPGIVMPMCHNIIEAMAVGSIPVTNYPEWLDPHLRHMENCIVFGDRADLVAKLKSVLQMDEAEIGRLRDNVVDYYETYLRPEAFVRRLEAHPDRAVPILMYTERNMVKRGSRLGRRSILMHSTYTPRPPKGLRRIAASLVG